MSSSTSSSTSSSSDSKDREEDFGRSPREPIRSWAITHSNFEDRNGNKSLTVSSQHSKQKQKKTRKERFRNEETSSYSDAWVKPVHVRPPWEMLSTAGSVPPRALTLTSVSQAHDLQEVLGMEAAHAEGQSSSDWLNKHSIKSGGLNFDDILNSGIRIKTPLDSSDPDIQHYKFDEARLQDYEFKLNNVIGLCQERVRWLLQGSRRSFGLVKGQNVALLVDASDSNCGYGRLQLFQESLQGLINEQLVNKDKLFLVSFGTEANSLWTVVRDNNCRIVEECRWWVNGLRPSGGCNLLAALKQVVKRKTLDSIVLVLGSSPDQNPKLICEYVKESLAGRKAPLHTVAYDCSVSATNVFLKELADQTEGRYHCYVSTSDDQIMTGTDLSLLVNEIQKAKGVLHKIQNMRLGLLGDKKIKIEHEVSPILELAKHNVPPSADLPQLDSSPLVVEHPSFPARTSGQWLQQHGLKAKGLNLYQVLAPNSYSFVGGYVSTINRNVKSRVHQQSMAQFKWHDGSVKNVHVDPTLLFDYQRHLESAVQLYKRRVDWLSVGCKKIFGTVVEQRVIVLLDMSVCMSQGSARLREHIRQVLEQQMANKTSYNFICFGGRTEMFRPAMVEPSPEYLEATWKWLLQRGCSGSRNFLDAFRLAVENEEEIKHGIEVEGIYLITSGVPDEPKDVVCGFISEALAGKNTSLHCIFYEVDDEDGLVAIPGRWADSSETAAVLKQIAHVANGRFHWSRNGGIIESDDVKAVLSEMEKAFNYSQKTAMLLETVRKKKLQVPLNRVATNGNQLVPRPPSAGKKMALTPPRHTALTKARINGRPQTAEPTRPESATSGKKSRPQSATTQTKDTTVKILCWKPPSAQSTGTLIPAVSPVKTGLKESRRRASSDGVKAVQQTFYTELKNDVGAVFTQYPTYKRIRNPIKHPAIPEKEENVSMREWMRHHSLTKLKLDLNTIVGSSECSHAKGKVPSLGQSVTARYCNIFPSVEVKGVVKHLHLLPHELVDYEDQVEKVMKRYVKRLQWLMSGSRRVFGTIVEKKVIVLIDTSGSMVSSMDELKRDLAALVWDQLSKFATKFNLIQFSSDAVSWKPTLVETTEANCQEAVEWLSDFEASGSTCTLEALEQAFEDPEVEGIYLLTDGKPDNSTAMVLREVARLNSARNVKVHTISFNCDDSSANKFLQLLASQTGGRFHRCQGDPDGHLFAHRLLTEGFREDEPLSMPVFEGDDLRRLGSEIALCRKFLLQSRSFRALFPGNPTKRPAGPEDAKGKLLSPSQRRTKAETAAR